MDRYYWQNGMLPRIGHEELVSLVRQHREGVKDNTNTIVEGLILHMCYVASKFASVRNHNYEDLLSAITFGVVRYTKKHIAGKLEPDIFILSVKCVAYNIAKETLIENTTIRVPYKSAKKIMAKQRLDALNLIVDSKGTNKMDARIGNEQETLTQNSAPIIMDSKYDFWEIVHMSAKDKLEWQVIDLYSQNYKRFEIAEQLELTVRVVSSILQRVLSRIRAHLKE